MVESMKEDIKTVESISIIEPVEEININKGNKSTKSIIY
jgi:hypothetical protein